VELCLDVSPQVIRIYSKFPLGIQKSSGSFEVSSCQKKDSGGASTTVPKNHDG